MPIGVLAVIEVDDTLTGLQELARGYRRRLRARAGYVLSGAERLQRLLQLGEVVRVQALIGAQRREQEVLDAHRSKRQVVTVD